MDQRVEDLEESAWQEVGHMLDAAARQQVCDVVRADAAALADLFYRQLSADPATAALLDHETVNRRLHASMVHWLQTLFDPGQTPARLIAMQRHVGEVHARIGVSARTVAAACRLLKRSIAQRVVQRSDDGARALQYVYELVDIATDTMGASMLASHARLTRSDESYRLFFLSRNLRAERERQRSHLLEWLQAVLFTHYWDSAVGDAPVAERMPTPFEQWVQHKAELLFEQEPELATLRDGVDIVRRGLVPRLREARRRGEDARALVAELHATGEQMKATLAALFDRAAGAEQGRDDVTQLLSRRYLPAIARREITLAQAGGRPFAVLMLELEGFDAISRTLGPDGTDLVVAQVADCVVESVRASDFAFRFGDSRLLVLVVDVDQGEARRVAEGLRARIAALPLHAPAGISPALAASFGVALYDGHPDYQYLIERAEQALHEAREGSAGHIVVVRSTS